MQSLRRLLTLLGVVGAAQVCGLRTIPSAEWATVVAELEFNHSLVPFVQQYGSADLWFSAETPPNSDNSDEEVEKHVPRMWQRSSTQVNIRVSHEMIWTPGEVVDFAHYIHYVYIRDSSTTEIVYVGVLEPGDTSVDIDTSVLGGLGGAGALVPYSFCNVHGLWKGAALQSVDPTSWNLAVASLKLYGEVQEECEGNVYLLDDSHSLQLGLVDKDGALVSDIDLATHLQVTFVFPRGHFLGLGFGDSMLGADMIIAAERDGTALCGDFHTEGGDSRYSGPNVDAQQDVQVVAATLEADTVTLVCTKNLRSSDPKDKAELTLQENLIWSYQQVADLPSLESNNFLQRHAATNRGYILNADLSGAGGELAIASSRDKRDLQVAHGMLMYMIWGINICVGAMIARYERHTDWWLGAHKIIQGINTVLTIPGYYLSQRFVDNHFQSAHAIIGTALVYASILQASLGTSAYLCSKYSKKIAREYPKAPGMSTDPEVPALSTAAKSIIADLETEHGPRELLHELYHHLDTLPADRTREITVYVEATIGKAMPSCVPPRLAVFVLTRVRQAFIRPVHRVVGRILPLMAYAQIYLGIDQLQANTVIRSIINMWSILVAIILVYKEIELQFRLPFGAGAKLKILKDRIYLICCRDSVSEKNGDDKEAARVPAEVALVGISSMSTMRPARADHAEFARSHSNILNDEESHNPDASPRIRAGAPETRDAHRDYGSTVTVPLESRAATSLLHSDDSCEDLRFATPPVPQSSPRRLGSPNTASFAFEPTDRNLGAPDSLSVEDDDDKDDQNDGSSTAVNAVETSTQLEAAAQDQETSLPDANGGAKPENANGLRPV